MAEGLTTYNPEDMDFAQELAQSELEFMVSEGLFSYEKFLDWYKRWYIKAGHKRLGRMFVKLAKELEVKNVPATKS